MFTMYDWRYRYGRAPKEAYRLELGMFTLGTDEQERRWSPTPLVEQLQRYIRDPAESIGHWEWSDLPLMEHR